ncbi:DUF1847 domain-containing protein [Chloroflexota bacterium]
MVTKAPQCVKCTVFRCRTKEKDKKVPQFCPTEQYPELIKETIEKHKLPENMAINLAWRHMMDNLSNPEKGRDRWSWTRVDEIMEYARIRGMKKLGIGTCYAMMAEARLLSDILEQNGFEVVSVSCLCGEVNPEDAGIGGTVFCNPIMQAELLNRENTDLNIMVGLCLGHDILFLRHCRAETTPLVVKDRALGHNTVAALYLSQGRYKDRFFENK